MFMQTYPAFTLRAVHGYRLTITVHPNGNAAVYLELWIMERAGIAIGADFFERDQLRDHADG